jgi:hypothetical protein
MNAATARSELKGAVATRCRWRRLGSRAPR